MQFRIQKKYLIEAIQATTNAISSRTVNPILSGMKIEVSEENIVLTGSNSDITIQSHINRLETKDNDEAAEEEIITEIIPGAIVLPVPHFPEIIKKLPTQDVL